MSSELSSTYSEILVRVQVRSYVRLANNSGGNATTTFIWSADNPDGVIFVIAMGGRAETWVFGHDLLKAGLLSHTPVGEGLVTCYLSVNTVRVTMASPADSDQWMRVSLNVDDVSRLLSAIDSRMLNVERADVEAEFMAWMDEPPC